MDINIHRLEFIITLSMCMPQHVNVLHKFLLELVH
jgi:hypothetical protein